MKIFETKNITGSVKDVDTTSRKVIIVLNRTGVKDSDEDIIEQNAFDKTISERGPKGKNLIWHLTDHYPSLKNAVGKFSELSMQGADLVGMTIIPNTTWGNDVLELYKSGNINQHSIGYTTVKKEVVNDDDPETRYQILKEITLYEGSTVLWGANEFTPTLSVGKSGSLKCPHCGKYTNPVMQGRSGMVVCSNCNQLFDPAAQKESELKLEFTKTMDDLGTLHKMFKNGHLSDGTYELIEIKLTQLTNKIQQLFEETTLPAQKAVEPENDGLLDVFKTFNNTLKTDDNAHKRRTAEAA